MRLIDADALKEMKFSGGMRDDMWVIHVPLREVMENIENAPTIGGWISADKRPPKQGRYLVWGLTRITPDHYDEANGFWEIQSAFWFEKSGWDRKVKFWQMLPEPPEVKTGE